MAFSKRIFMAFYNEYGMSPVDMSNRIKESTDDTEYLKIEKFYTAKKKVKKNDLELSNNGVQK